ncbi:MAG: S41 family peptidase [Brevundimonas sp.]|uniref:S41 family peptidase n=1 Tax=Brevundimonas sp. TaxID=1871086 RepID=UPI002487AEBB|nr:S41 family peptidase [Brevundimonas sp.]MDI1325834.1 S41 family peptidase [Brevundimonas sp.]
MIFRRLFERLAVSAAMSLALFAAPAFAGDPAIPSAAPSPAPASAPAAPSRDRIRMNQRVFDQVWNEVRREYYDPHLHGVDWSAARRTWRPVALAAPDDRMLYRSLREMLNLLDDDHAGAAPPAVARRQDQLRAPRAAVGLSLRADRDNQDSYLVEQVREGSPADEAGVGVGWRLITDGATGWTPEQDVVEGRPLVLTMIDAEGAARPTILNPRVMEPRPAFVADRTRPNVLVLRVEGFEQGLGRWMGQQLADLAPETDVVLDLRGNPGGRLMEADAVLSCFLPTNRAWATRTSRNGRRIELKTAGGCGGLTGPVANDVAVLVDDQSRSAAELTPAALQEARRAVVVGVPTAGAVLISQETRLPDGGRLTLSRADFVTSGGVRLEKLGVTPDVAAAVTPQDRRAGRDPALEAAVAALAPPRPDRAQAAIAAPL